MSSQYPVGVDFASVDEDPTPDFVSLRASGVRFAIMRAVFGRNVNGKPYLDPTFGMYCAKARAAGMRTTAYGFLCAPQAGVYTPEPEVQAQALIDQVTPHLIPGRDYVPAFDVEQASTLGPEAYYAWVMRYAKVLFDHFGVWSILYFSARVWAEYFNGHSPGPLVNCPLWIAKPWPQHIKTTADLSGEPGYQPTLVPEWSNQWFLYQYQGDARNFPNDAIKQADLSRFRVFGQGAKGAHVVWLQKRLVTVDAAVKVDGDFGPITKRALQVVQSNAGLAPDGIFGVDSFAPVSWIKIPA